MLVYSSHILAFYDLTEDAQARNIARTHLALLTSFVKRGLSFKKSKALAGTDCKQAPIAAPVSAAFQGSDPVLVPTACASPLKTRSPPAPAADTTGSERPHAFGLGSLEAAMLPCPAWPGSHSPLRAVRARGGGCARCRILRPPGPRQKWSNLSCGLGQRA